jgi:hypothetical protein
MHSSTQGVYEWLAVAGAAGALLCLMLLIWAVVMIRRLRRAQKLVLAGNERDIVGHAEALQREFVSLRDWLEDVSVVLDKRMTRLETRLDGAVTHTGMVRYDAFGAKSGKQSSSVALLDEHRNGVVLTAIVSRNFSHLYVKHLDAGVSDIELSPEERHAVELAFAEPGEPPAAPPPPAPTRIVSGSSARPPEPPGEPEIHQASASVER